MLYTFMSNIKKVLFLSVSALMATGGEELKCEGKKVVFSAGQVRDWWGKSYLGGRAGILETMVTEHIDPKMQKIIDPALKETLKAFNDTLNDRFAAVMDITIWNMCFNPDKTTLPSYLPSKFTAITSQLKDLKEDIASGSLKTWIGCLFGLNIIIGCGLGCLLYMFNQEVKDLRQQIKAHEVTEEEGAAEEESEGEEPTEQKEAQEGQEIAAEESEDETEEEVAEDESQEEGNAEESEDEMEEPTEPQEAQEDQEITAEESEDETEEKVEE